MTYDIQKPGNWSNVAWLLGRCVLGSDDQKYASATGSNKALAKIEALGIAPGSRQ